MATASNARVHSVSQCEPGYGADEQYVAVPGNRSKARLLEEAPYARTKHLTDAAGHVDARLRATGGDDLSAVGEADPFPAAAGCCPRAVCGTTPHQRRSQAASPFRPGVGRRHVWQEDHRIDAVALRAVHRQRRPAVRG